MKFATVLLAAVLALGALDADAARRLGGGGSLGRQSSNVTQRYGTPPAAPTRTPDTTTAQRQATPQPAPGTTAQPQRRTPWGGILGGLAAGLGLAWLAHSLGLGAGFANVLLILLVAMLVMIGIGMMRRRQQGQSYAYQGMGGSADAPISPRQYNPEKVGNDASARPWEQGATPFDTRDAGGGVRIGSGLAPQPADVLSGSQTWGIPGGFDTEGFLQSAKRNFLTLQDAWDRSDFATLRSMMTDEMLVEIRRQIAERDREAPASSPQKTEVVMLEAQLLGIEELETEYMASVEFSGMIREEPSAGPTPFREAWNMIKPKDGSAGWLVAGVQALQ